MSSKKKSEVKSKKLNQTNEVKENVISNDDMQVVLDNDSSKKIIKKNLKQAGGAPKQKKSVGESKIESKSELKIKTKEKKKEKQKTSKKEVSNDNEVNEESSEKRIRSFKVKLPNKEDYEGRFTGLTPYQAANKALSKYFRENPESLEQITFSISESTRNSKKTNYTYVGKREKLEVPVVYKIQDGREIVKNFKNSLKKVKKAELTSSN